MRVIQACCRFQRRWLDTDQETMRATARACFRLGQIQQGVPTAKRLEESFVGGKIDPELVGEVDGPLGRCSVIYIPKSRTSC